MHMLRILFCSVLVLLSSNIALLAQVKEGGATRVIEEMNTEMDDFFPCWTPDGKEIYFSRKTKSNSNDKEFYILKTKEITPKNWSEPVAVTRINGGYEPGIGHISSDGSRFYIQGTFQNPKNGRQESGIFIFLKSGEAWKIMDKIRIPYFRNLSNDQSFCMSHDESTLIISMQHFATQGVEDLYFSKRKEDGTWTELESLGKNVNTPYEEFYPWLDYDNRTLFYSTNGFSTLGSKDIFVTYRMDDTWKNWSPPINLGPLVNTEGMDLAFQRSPVDPDHFLLVAAQSSEGHTDIYQYFFPDSVLPHPIRVFELDTTSQSRDLASHSVLQLSDQNRVRVVALNRNKDHLIPYEARILDSQGLFLDSALASAGDTLSFDILYDTVFLKVNSPEHLSVEKRIVFSNKSVGVSNLEIIYLDSLVSGKAIRLDNVLFAKGTPTLLPSSYLQLDRVQEFLESHPEKEIMLLGHTDIAGNKELNQKLSEDRAKAVKAYLVDRGIKSNRISTEGYGGDKPLTRKRDEKSRVKNRRVEFIIL